MNLLILLKIIIATSNSIYQVLLKITKKIIISSESKLDEAFLAIVDDEKELNLIADRITMYCKYHLSCLIRGNKSLKANYCPRCICQEKVIGCTRDWCVNYNPKANIDVTDTSNVLEANDKTNYSKFLGCIAPWDLLRRMRILVSGKCENCTQEILFKIDNRIILKTNKFGLYGLIIQKNPELNQIKQLYTLNSEELEAFLSPELEKDVFIFVFFMIDKLENIVNSSAVKLSQLLLKLNAQQPVLISNINYIFLTSSKKDIYYEASSVSELTYPNLSVQQEGCRNIPDADLTLINDNILNYPKAEIDPGALIQRCAIASLSNSNKNFAIKNNKCYYVKDYDKYKIIKTIPSLTNIPKCRSNNELYWLSSKDVPNYNVAHIYNINQEMYEIYDLNLPKSEISLYSLPNYPEGTAIRLNEGVYSMKDYLNISEIKSMQVPEGMLVAIQDSFNKIVISILGEENISDMSEYLSKLQTTKIQAIKDNIKKQVDAVNADTSNKQKQILQLESEITTLNDGIKKMQEEYAGKDLNQSQIDAFNKQVELRNKREGERLALINGIDENEQKIKDLNNEQIKELKEETFYSFTSDDKIVVSNISNCAIIFQLAGFKGFALSFPMGKFVFPEAYRNQEIGSIKLPQTSAGARVYGLTLYSDTEFKNEIAYYENPISGEKENTSNTQLGNVVSLSFDYIKYVIIEMYMTVNGTITSSKDNKTIYLNPETLLVTSDQSRSKSMTLPKTGDAISYPKNKFIQTPITTNSYNFCLGNPSNIILKLKLKNLTNNNYNFVVDSKKGSDSEYPSTYIISPSTPIFITTDIGLNMFNIFANSIGASFPHPVEVIDNSGSLMDNISNKKYDVNFIYNSNSFNGDKGNYTILNDNIKNSKSVSLSYKQMYFVPSGKKVQILNQTINSSYDLISLPLPAPISGIRIDRSNTIVYLFEKDATDYYGYLYNNTGGAQASINYYYNSKKERVSFANSSKNLAMMTIEKITTDIRNKLI